MHLHMPLSLLYNFTPFYNLIHTLSTAFQFNSIQFTLFEYPFSPYFTYQLIVLTGEPDVRGNDGTSCSYPLLTYTPPPSFTLPYIHPDT